jgi:hypothetical protein
MDLNQYRVRLVDVNDVWFTLDIEAETIEEAQEIAERNCPGCKVREALPYGQYDDEEYGDGMTDVEADADTLRNCGWGTDEDYGYQGEEYL